MKTDGSNSKSVATTEKKGTLGEWLKERKDSFNQALPANTVNVDRFMQSAMLAITNPKMPNLRLCSKESIFRSLKEAASYGLELNGTFGQAYLIPYNEKVNGKYEMTCHFQLGYRGIIQMARRSNTIKTIAAEPICENDYFKCKLASGRTIEHEIDITKERGDVIGYYCLVELCNGGSQFKVMSKKDIENHRDKFSKAYDAKDPNNIWNKNFDAMALKTVVIQALKLCPISIEAMDAVITDERKDIKDISDDVEYTVSDAQAETTETPAIEEPKEQPKEPKPETKKEPVQPSFDEMNGMTDEEMAQADAAFDSVPENPNDIF